MASDDLRRQADMFVDLFDLAAHISRPGGRDGAGGQAGGQPTTLPPSDAPPA
jgi:hypothetical protein